MEMEENDGVGKQGKQGNPNQDYQMDQDEQQENEDIDPNGVEYACGIFLTKEFLIIHSQRCEVGGFGFDGPCEILHIVPAARADGAVHDHARQILNR